MKSWEIAAITQNIEIIGRLPVQTDETNKAIIYNDTGKKLQALYVCLENLYKESQLDYFQRRDIINI